MPDYLPTIGSPNFPPIIPSWMHELGTPYLGCSMIYGNYINIILCAIAQASPTLNACISMAFQHHEFVDICTYHLAYSPPVAMSSCILTYELIARVGRMLKYGFEYSFYIFDKYSNIRKMRQFCYDLYMCAMV